MKAIALWLSVAAGLVMLTNRLTRNPAYLLLAGSVLFLFLSYDLANIPEVRQVGILFWSAAAVLLFSNLRALQRRRRSA